MGRPSAGMRRVQVTCTNCDGTGKVKGITPALEFSEGECQICNGTGKRMLEMKIDKHQYEKDDQPPQ